MTERTLDWRSRHDERSREYPVRALIASAATRRDRQWRPGPILDQGREGACVGFAWAAEAFATPISVDLARVARNTPDTPTGFALFLYGMAKYLDPWEGQDYSGTSVLAGAQSTQNMGLLREYRWAFGIDDVIDAVIHVGPVVVGIPWFHGMYEAPGGVLTRSGNFVGGHALLVTGYSRSSDRVPGKETLTVQNSWGSGWGNSGMAEITTEGMSSLLADRGEACVPIARSYGRTL
jgi:hypothetical protein